MSKKYKVIVSHRANEMFTDHLRFLSKATATGAKKLSQRMNKSLRTLESFPYSHTFFYDDMNIIPQNKYRKMYVEKFYLVLYQVIDDTVFVEYILDCRQDYQWLL